MELYKQIDKSLKKIYEEFKKDKSDLTGWGLMKRLKKEANFEEELINFFIYRIYKLSYKKREIINVFSYLAELISYPYNEEEWIRVKGKNPDEEIEFSPKLFFKKGIKTKILEALELDKTLKAYYHYLICREEELNEKKHLNKNQIKKCRYWDSAIGEILDIFKDEWKKKYPNPSKIIKLSG